MIECQTPVREGRRQRQKPTSFALLSLRLRKQWNQPGIKAICRASPRKVARYLFSVQRDSGWPTTLFCLGLSQFGGKIPWTPTQSWANWKLISHLAGRSGSCWGRDDEQAIVSYWLDGSGLRGVNWSGYHMADGELRALPQGDRWDLVIKVNWSSHFPGKASHFVLLTDTNIFSSHFLFGSRLPDMCWPQFLSSFIIMF